MRIVIKEKRWKHVTFKTPKINFKNWAAQGLKVIIGEKKYIFKTPKEIEALWLSVQPSYKGNTSCFITVEELKSIYIKTKERMEKIELLNGAVYNKEELLQKMYSDTFYYGELGEYALSSSAVKQLIKSPKAYQRSLNFKEDTSAFKVGRLVHLAALEPEKLDTLIHIVPVKSENTKLFKEKVTEVGSSQFVYTQTQYEKSMYSVDALLQNDIWKELTKNAKFEQPAFDILHGYPFRAKADILGFDFIADLKTTINLDVFFYSARKNGYDVQVYIYCKLFKQSYKDFIFFAIDKSTGDLGIYDVEESFYESGKNKVEQAIEVFEKYIVKQEESLENYVIKGTLK